MPLSPYAVYNQQLSSLSLGYAPWEPDLGKLYDHVSVGDVHAVQTLDIWRAPLGISEVSHEVNIRYCTSHSDPCA
jgi:hypothetical protein